MLMFNEPLSFIVLLKDSGKTILRYNVSASVNTVQHPIFL
jgi:hypothetical protein